MAKSHRKAKCLSRQPEFSRLDRSRSFFLIGLTLLILLFMGASIFYINTHVEMVETGYDINIAMAQKQKLIEENQRLSLQIAQLKSPTRIEQEAKNTLNLLTPGPEQFVYLSSLEKTALFQNLPEKEPSQSDPQPPKKPAKLKEPKIAQAPAQKSPAKKVSQAKVKSPQKSTAPVKPKNEKVLIAKIIRTPATETAKTLSTSPKKPSRKGKEIIPAVLIDSMP